MISERYQRSIPTLTEAECEALRHKRVVVVGCGGLGGYLIELLARMGVGFLRVVDGDVFDASNLNRQLLAEESLLGTSKAEAARLRVRAINSEVEVQAVSAYLTEENAPTLLSDCDAVLDGLDNIRARRLLSRVCAECSIPLVHGAAQGWECQAALSLPGDGLIEALYPRELDTTPQSTPSFTPALCAAMQVALCVQLLVGRPVDSGTLHYFDLLHQVFTPIPVVL